MLSKTVKDALVKSSVEYLIGEVFGGLSVSSLVAAVVRHAVKAPLAWQITAGFWGFTLGYMLVLRYRQYWAKAVTPKHEASELPVRLKAKVEDGIVRIGVFNDGPSQEFAGEFLGTLLARPNNPDQSRVFPMPI